VIQTLSAPVTRFDGSAKPVQPSGPLDFSSVSKQSSTGGSFTSNAGFPVMVVDSPQPALMVFKGVSDQYVEANKTQVSFSLPADAFAHSDQSQKVELEAKQANGKPLPNWVMFNPQSGTFTVNPPDDYRGEMRLKVTARDTQGREAIALFRFHVGDQKSAAQPGPKGITEQLRQAAKRPAKGG
jgi:hypothetical protein